jgi:hypothetical protein
MVKKLGTPKEPLETTPTDKYKTVDSGYDPDKVTVDCTKFKVGDWVTVRTKILSYAGPKANVLPIRIEPNPWINEIIAHEPADG